MPTGYFSGEAYTPCSCPCPYFLPNRAGLIYLSLSFSLTIFPQSHHSHTSVFSSALPLISLAGSVPAH